MPGTVRGYPEVGMRIVTPDGVETITKIANQTELAFTEGGSAYPMEDLRCPEPESRTPEAIEEWLAGPELMLVTTETESCSCECGKGGLCYLATSIRGASKVIAHMKNQGCNCPMLNCPCAPGYTVATGYSIAV